MLNQKPKETVNYTKIFHQNENISVLIKIVVECYQLYESESVVEMIKEKNTCNSCGESKFDGFVESVEEEIRNENWQILWNKYGKLITYASVALIAGAGLYNFWQGQKLAEREAISSKFTLVQNMLMSGDKDKALSQIRVIASSNQEEYAAFAKLEYAAALRAKKDKEALIQYKSLAEDEHVAKVIKDLAYIYYVSSSIDLMSIQEITANLDGFIKELSEKYVN